MRDLGVLLASNDILPARIVVSEWCRNQQTLEHLAEGFDLVDPEIARDMPVETDAGLNLLLSLQGSKDVEALRARVSAWDGRPRSGGAAPDRHPLHQYRGADAVPGLRGRDPRARPQAGQPGARLHQAADPRTRMSATSPTRSPPRSSRTTRRWRWCPGTTTR